MLLHPSAEDAAYAVHPVPPVTWLSHRQRVKFWCRSSSRKDFQLYVREYVLSSLFLGLIACALLMYVGLGGVWAARNRLVWQVNLALKRAFDVCGALVGLICTAPIFLVLSILIKLDSPGPIFFRQLRVGINRRHDERRRNTGDRAAGRRHANRRANDLHGRPFEIIKFRSMMLEAEKHCGPVWATPNDPRITQVGSFIRVMRLDELPQLINVLKGEMSLVGPRPERPFFVEKLAREVPGFVDRLRVAPGITGLAQVKNGYDLSLDHAQRKVHYDLSYIRNLSPMNDLKIIISTVLVVVTGRGAC